MYEQFFGFNAKPFSLLPEADFLYLSKRHRTALSLLEYGMESQAGFVVITGDVGAGKTTTLRRFLKNRSNDLTVGIVTNASTTFGSLMSWVSMAFGLDHKGQDNVALYNQFLEFIIAQYAAGKRTLLVIDEAQNLDTTMLEDLRMLSNVNNDRDQILQMVLVGQPELLAKLNTLELRQFAQRITVHYHLTPLDATETAAYIRHRLGVAGGSPDLFDDLACATAYYFTGGVPRLINLLCDLALVYAFAEELSKITFDTIADVACDRSESGLSSFKRVPEGVARLSLRAEISAIADESNGVIAEPSESY